MSHVIKAHFRTGPKYWTGETADNWTAYITGAKKMNQATARRKIGLLRELCGPLSPQFEAVEIDDRDPKDSEGPSIVTYYVGNDVATTIDEFQTLVEFAKRGGFDPTIYIIEPNRVKEKRAELAAANRYIRNI